MKFSFESWAKEANPIELAGQRALIDLVAEDTAHQLQLQEAGGTMSSDLTLEAQEVAAKITAHTKEQIEAVHRPQQQLMDAEHRRLAENVSATGEPFAAALRELSAFEDVMVPFLMKAKVAPRRRITDNDSAIGLQALVDSARRLVQPVPVRGAVPAARPTLMRPNFSGLLARVLGRA